MTGPLFPNSSGSAASAAAVSQQGSSRTAGEFSKQLAELRAQLDRVEAGQKTNQLPYSSLESGGFIMAYNDQGHPTMRVGFQSDGTSAVTYSNGTPPPQPTPPIVAARQLAVFVAWDGTFENGADKPGDFLRVDVHMSLDPAFAPDGTTIVGTMPDAGGILVGADNATHYIRIVAVTHAKDETGVFVASTPTPAVQITALPAQQIAAQAIGTDELEADFVFASRIIVGNSLGAHLEIEGRDGMPAGLTLFDHGLAPTVTFDADTGDATIRGTFRTADSGTRITVNEDADNSIQFWNDDDSLHTSLIQPYVFTWNGTQYAGIDVKGPFSDQGNQSLVELASYGATMSFGKSMLNIQYQYAGLLALDDNGVGGTVTVYAGSASIGWSNDFLQFDQNGPYLHANSSSESIAFAMGNWAWHLNGASLACDSNNCYVTFNNTGIDIQQQSGNYLSVGAAGYATKPSARAEKTAIEHGPHDFEQVVRDAPAHRYEVTAERRAARAAGQVARKKIGPMADDVPDDLVATFGDGTVGLWLDSQVGILWGATGAQSDRLDAIEARLDAMGVA